MFPKGNYIKFVHSKCKKQDIQKWDFQHNVILKTWFFSSITEDIKHFKSLFFHNWIPDHYFFGQKEKFSEFFKYLGNISNQIIQFQSSIFLSKMPVRERLPMTKLCVILMALLGECSKSFTFYVIRTIISSGYFKTQLWLKQETQFYSEL